MTTAQAAIKKAENTAKYGRTADMALLKECTTTFNGVTFRATTITACKEYGSQFSRISFEVSGKKVSKAKLLEMLTK